jgi:rhamnose transport system permease protein
MIKLIKRPETITVVLLIIAFGVSALLSPYFLDAHFLFDSTSQYMEIGIMALAMTYVIISGNIDLSVASGLALVAVSCSLLFERGVPMAAIIPIALLLGALLGLFNGILITKLGLPSLTVTLGTLALYRGIAQVLLGDRSVSGFPDWFAGLDYRKIGDLIPAPLIIFLVLACVFAVVLHKTVFGRCVYAIGTNEPAARFSGLQVNRVKISVFVISGLTMGIGALMSVSRLSVARYNVAAGDELAVITAVVLGGTDIFGGRGSIFGTVVALFLLGILRRGMGVANIPAEKQLAVTGSLLVVAVILANLTNKLGATTRSKRAAPVTP